MKTHLDLSFHGNNEQDYKIHNKDGPKHWNIECIETCAD